MGGGEYDRTATLSADDAIERVLRHRTNDPGLNAVQSGGVAEIRIQVVTKKLRQSLSTPQSASNSRRQ
jgi:hypothetical protein